jgi:ribose transport system substrate-binding protein
MTVVGLALGLLLVGASSASVASKAQPRAGNPVMNIDYANFSDGSAFLKDFGQGFVNAAKVAGYKMKYYNNNLDGPTAIRNAHLMVQDKPDLILEANAVAGVGNAIGKIFADAQIPCISINVATPGCPLLNQINQAVGTSAAQAMAPFAKAAGDNGSNTTILLVQDAAAGTELNKCVTYFYETLTNMLPGFDKMAAPKISLSTTKIGNTGVQVSATDLQSAYTAVKNVLPSIPSDRRLIVMVFSDPLAEGALRAITEAGRINTTLISGQGGGADGIHYLRTTKQWVIEPSVFNTTWSELAMAMVKAYSDGQKLPPLTTVLQKVMTKQNVDQYYTKSGTVFHLPPLASAPPPGNAYLAKTGVLQKFGNVTGL